MAGKRMKLGRDRQWGEEMMEVTMAQNPPPTTVSLCSQGGAGANSHITTYKDGQHQRESDRGATTREDDNGKGR
jgi:hypothetical protein